MGGVGALHLSDLKDQESSQVQTRASIPIHMVIAGMINNAMWTPMSGLGFLFVTNVCCATLGVAQLTVYMIYHPRKPLAWIRSRSGRLALEEQNDDVSVRPPSVHTSSKVAPESPIYQTLASPLATLRS
ncbi:hypothetical protein JG688_00011200 [Phytophthora aleatoria]|uniref:MtN3-like protein n=1 Tax=Phytophthora aleatoria TaxID=2496075 RepID=A0A8J5J0U3_9STRA|nr:hypothetical protein JG688_00011200 [Phytophthora aleatoria]